MSRLVWNAVIYWSAVRRLPEFSGHSGRRYPGQQPPRPREVEPRRMRLPPTFSQVLFEFINLFLFTMLWS